MTKQLIYLKLVSGEDLIGYVEELDDTHVRITKPLRASLIDSLFIMQLLRLQFYLVLF